LTTLATLRTLARRHQRLRRLTERHPQLVSRFTMLMTQNIQDPIERAGASGFFNADDIDAVARVVFDEGHASPRYAHLQHAHMTLPPWFRQDLDPYGPEYLEQQKRLWRLIAGVERDYEPDLDEKEAPIGDVDSVRFPGFFMRRDPDAVSSASDHVIASGMILKHSGLRPGGSALEYGAGFGHTSVSLARLGVNVDTVDISRAFCQHVQNQADHLQLPLTAHLGHFGMNPRPGHRYDLVFFYESFHHCLDWQALMRRLPELITDSGRVILCGEPMAERAYAAVPYPWGIRLQSDVVATIRRLHWFELGFTEDFLYEIFTRAGFRIHRHRCEPSLWGRTYVAERHPNEIHLGELWLPPAMEDSEWHGAEADGRWTRGNARLAICEAWEQHALEMDLANPSGSAVELVLQRGRSSSSVRLAAGERRTVTLLPSPARHVSLRCEARRLDRLGRWINRGDRRELGVFVRRLRLQH